MPPSTYSPICHVSTRSSSLDQRPGCCWHGYLHILHTHQCKKQNTDDVSKAACEGVGLGFALAHPVTAALEVEHKQDATEHVQSDLPRFHRNPPFSSRLLTAAAPLLAQPSPHELTEDSDDGRADHDQVERREQAEHQREQQLDAKLGRLFLRALTALGT